MCDSSMGKVTCNYLCEGWTMSERPDAEMVLIEISRHDWDRMHCGCLRSAAHVPADLLRLITAQTPNDVHLAGINNHVTIQSMTHEPAPATAAVIMAALASTSTVPVVRRELLSLLLGFLWSDSAYAKECEAVIRGGLWTLYHELTAGPGLDCAGYAYEILSLIEGEEDRLRTFRQALGNRLPADLR